MSYNIESKTKQEIQKETEELTLEIEKSSKAIKDIQEYKKVLKDNNILTKEDLAILDKYRTTSAITYIKYKQFVNKYISLGFQGIQAYQEVYKDSCGNSASTNSSRLLRKPIVIELLNKELTRISIDSLVNKEYLILKALEKLDREGQRDSDVVKILEFLGKVTGITKDNTQNTFVFQGLEQKTNDLLKKHGIIDADYE